MADPVHTVPARVLPGQGDVRRHVLVVLVLNRPGVLNRVASLMRARDFNIETLAVSHTDKPEISRMTITLWGDDGTVEQAAKQIYRLIDVLKVQDVTAEPTLEHEIALIKVRADSSVRGEVLSVLDPYRARVVDLAARSLIVEACGSEAEIDALISLLRGFGVSELVRSGVVVMSRGAGSIEEEVKL
jgi:acetolactate synthase-1/3 small subunit